MLQQELSDLNEYCFAKNKTKKPKKQKLLFKNKVLAHKSRVAEKHKQELNLEAE